MQSNENLTKLRIIKNVAIICVGALLLFISYDGLTMLQSTMNRDQGVGVASQAVLYACFAISALLLPNYVIKKLGSKLTFACSMCTYIPYVASNFYPHYSLMIPTSILIGFGAALLWGSQASYLNDVSILYTNLQISKDDLKNKLSGTKPERSLSLGQISYTPQNNINVQLSLTKYKTFQKSDVIDSTVTKGRYSVDIPSVSESIYDSSIKVKDCVCAGKLEAEQYSIEKEARDRSKALESNTARFFGIHGMFYLSSHLWSNLITYTILKNNSSAEKNTTLVCACGPVYCNVESECFENNIEEPSDRVRYILTSVCVCVGLISVFIVAVFLDPLDKDDDVKFSFDQLLATYKLAKRKEILLLLPSSLYIGMVQGFYASDFNKAYIGCAWGAYHVGLVAVCYGVFCGLSSTSAGWLVKKIGRVPIFCTTILINVASIGFLRFWKPTSQEPVMFFVAAGMWGIYVGVFWSQLRAFYGILFKKDKEAAFAAFHVWYSLGFCFSFAYSNYLCTSVKLYLLLTVCLLGFAGYLLVERLHAKNKMKH